MILNIKTFSIALSYIILGPSGCINLSKNNVTVPADKDMGFDLYQTTIIDIYRICPSSLNGYKFIKDKKISMNKVCYFEPSYKQAKSNITQNDTNNDITTVNNQPNLQALSSDKTIGYEPELLSNEKDEVTSTGSFLEKILDSTYLFQPTKESGSLIINNKTIRDLNLEKNEKVTFKNGSISAAKQVMENSSKVKLSRLAIESSEKSVDLVRAALRPQITGSLYAGLENVDNPGVGAFGSLNLSKLLYDGGQSKVQELAIKSDVNALFENYREVVNQELLSNLSAIVELDLAFRLNALGRTRVDRLDDLKQKLSVLKMAGAIDVTTIAQSNLLVSKLMLRVEELEQQFEIAQQKFKNIYGIELTSTPMDKSLRNFCEKTSNSETNLLGSPSILREYFYLEKARNELEELRTKSSYTIGVEAGVQQTIGMTNTQLTPSFGLVLRKNLSDGKKLDTEIKLAEKKIISQEQIIKAQYQLLETKVKEIQINRRSFKQKLDLNNLNIQYTLDEILFLEKQLAIGQSNLTSIVSAEAQLFELETQSSRLMSENYLSKLMLLASLGQLTDELNIKLAPLY